MDKQHAQQHAQPVKSARATHTQLRRTDGRTDGRTDRRINAQVRSNITATHVHAVPCVDTADLTQSPLPTVTFSTSSADDRAHT